MISGFLVAMACTTQPSLPTGSASASSATVDLDTESTSASIDQYLAEEFVDSLKVGRSRLNSVMLKQVRTTDSVYVQLVFRSKEKRAWVDRNNSTWLKDGISGLHAELADFNNDGYKDVTFISATAARGANEVRRLFIYDPLSDQLRFITNSMNYPNLRYNPKLKCIDGFRVYGGSSTDFLRLQGDSLFMFATVDLGEGVVVTTYDADPKGQVIHQDATYEGGYIRFDNYSPLEVLEGDW